LELKLLRLKVSPSTSLKPCSSVDFVTVNAVSSVTAGSVPLKAPVGASFTAVTIRLALAAVLPPTDPDRAEILRALARGLVTRGDLDRMDTAVLAQVNEAAAFAVASPPRKAESALEHVFA
jgi:hypothetical protein